MPRMRTLRRAVLTALFLAALVLPLGCAKRSNEILVGVYGSLTGTTATFGISTKNGTELFVDNFNNAGGIAGTKIRTFVEDDQSRPEEAATAVTTRWARAAFRSDAGRSATTSARRSTTPCSTGCRTTTHSPTVTC